MLRTLRSSAAVRRQLGEAQATYKRAIDTCTKEMSNAVKARDCVYLDVHQGLS